MIDPHNPNTPIVIESQSSDREIKVELSLEQSKIVEWDDHPKQVLWMITDKKDVGIVVHSEDPDIKLGSTMKLAKLKLKPFIGNLNIDSK